MRSGPVELAVGDVQVAVREDVLPRHEHVGEDDERIGLVEAGAERVVETARVALGVGAPRVDAQARCVRRDDEGDGVVLASLRQREDAAHEDVVAQDRAGAEHLRTLDDDAIVALLGHAHVEVLLVLFVRRLCPVDGRMNDRIAEVQALIAAPRVEAFEVVGELLATLCEHRKCAYESSEERGDVVRAAAEEAARLVRPCFDGEPPRCEVGTRPRRLPPPMHGLTVGGRVVAVEVAVGRVCSDVVQVGHGVRDAGEGGMGGEVLDAFAIEHDLAAIVERLEEFCSGAGHVTLLA